MDGKYKKKTMKFLANSAHGVFFSLQITLKHNVPNFSQNQGGVSKEKRFFSTQHKN